MLPSILRPDVRRPQRRKTTSNCAGRCIGMRNARLVLSDGTSFDGEIFGSTRPVCGEVVFNTGMAGYVETLTDPSYAGQILVLTYPLIGNYGVPEPRTGTGLARPYESDRIQVQGLSFNTTSTITVITLGIQIAAAVASGRGRAGGHGGGYAHADTPASRARNDAADGCIQPRCRSMKQGHKQHRLTCTRRSSTVSHRPGPPRTAPGISPCCSSMPEPRTTSSDHCSSDMCA